jgi:hypothetical protein
MKGPSEKMRRERAIAIVAPKDEYRLAAAFDAMIDAALAEGQLQA